MLRHANGRIAVCLIGHGMNAGRVDPAIVEIEQRADRNGIVQLFIGPSRRADRVDIAIRYARRVVVHAIDEAEQRFLGIGE